jgi:5-methylthioadenosine/S-adenosylhomocysteine deaminase
MVHLTAAEIALAAAAGIAVISCPEASLASGNGAPPAAAWSAAGLRVGVGSGTTATAALDPRSAARLLAIPDAADIATGRFAALSLATRGGAAALGLEADIGTLEKGKWADLCCLDLRGAATLRQAARAPRDSSMPLHLAMGPAAVRDVWVAGRHLVNDGAYTRLDWPALASRVSAWAPTTRHWR